MVYINTEVIFMSKSKHKVRKLTDEQYNAYISTLKEDPALYSSDGTAFVPANISHHTQPKKGD
jgi:hypothetical protein